MLKRSLLTATVGAGLLALAGGAFAQSGTTTSPGSQPERSSPSATSPSTGSGSTMERSPGAPGSAAESASPSGAGASAAKPSAPSQALVGKPIVNAKGDKIGEVEQVAGNQLIVSVGGFLGIGDRKVAIDWDKVNMQGAGEDARMQTAMTKEELEALPEYKEGGASGAGGASRESPSTPSTGGTSAPSR